MFSETFQAAPVGMDKVDVDQMQAFPSAFRCRQIALSVRGKRDPLAVGRPGRAEVAAVAGSQWPGLARCQIENPEIGGSRGPRSNKHDPFTIGRAGGLIVIRGILRQPMELSTVRVNAIQVRRAVSF